MPTTFGTETQGAAVAGRPAAPSEAEDADADIVKLPTTAAKPGVRNVKGSATVTLTVFAVTRYTPWRNRLACRRQLSRGHPHLSGIERWFPEAPAP